MDAIISNTVYWVLGGLVLVGFLGLPLLRATAMLVTGVFAAVRMIDGWVKSRPLGAGPERPLSLQGLPPALADLTRQTRFLTLELRRHSELAPSWPQAPTDGKQSWWSALVGIGGFEPHTEAMREVWERARGSRAGHLARAMAGLAQLSRRVLGADLRLPDRPLLLLPDPPQPKPGQGRRIHR